MLGAVVAEQPLRLRHAAYRAQVADEHADARDALHECGEARVFDTALDPARGGGRGEHEERRDGADRQRHRGAERVLVRFVRLDAGRDLSGPDHRPHPLRHSIAQHRDAAQDRDAAQRATGYLRAVGTIGEFAVGFANAHRRAFRSADHDAFDDCLAA